MARAALAHRRAGAFLVRGVPEPAKPELLVDLRRHPRLHAGIADHLRRDPGDALHARGLARLQIRRRHHARRELRLAAALLARQRRLDVLLCRLHPHLPRHVLRLLQGTARGAVAARHRHLPADDGDRLHGLRAALGPDELLGRHRHHLAVRRDPGDRQLADPPAVGRLRRRQRDAESLLLAALPAAVHDRRRRRPAHLGAARAGLEQPRWHREEDREGHAALPPLFHGEGRLRAGLLPDLLLPGSSSTSRTISTIPTITSRRTRW